jgi:hypothetical protein
MSRGQVKKQGLLEYFISMNPVVSTEITAPSMTDEQRADAISEFGIRHIEERIKSDKELRARVRKTLANMPPEKTGIKNFVSSKDGTSRQTLIDEVIYILVQLHLKQGVSKSIAFKLVADNHGYAITSIRRKYKSAVASRKVWLFGGKKD